MKFSVVMPSYQQGVFIERSIASVLAQQGVAFDFIVVDGGSTDGTVDVLVRHTDELRYVSEADRGQTHAMNKGIAATDGDIIAWLNSDDIYLPGAFAAVASAFAAHPEIDIVYGDADYIDVNDTVIKAYQVGDWDAESLRETCFLCQPAVFFRRRLVDVIGPLAEHLRFCMDYEYWLRAAKFGTRVMRIEQKLAASRLYADNKTLKYRSEIPLEIGRMMRDLYGNTSVRWILTAADLDAKRKASEKGGSYSRHFWAMVTTLQREWNGRISPSIVMHAFFWWQRTLSRRLRGKPECSLLERIDGA